MAHNYPLSKNSPTMQAVLRTLLDKAPLSAEEIARTAGISASTLVNGGYLRGLREEGCIHIAGWGKNANGFTIALYATGFQPDCHRPKFRDQDRDSEGMARIVAALKTHSSQGVDELARAAGLSSNTVRGRRYMDILLKQERVHICAWERGRRGKPHPLYAAGRGKCAPIPTPLSRKEINARYRMRSALRSGRLPSITHQLLDISNRA